MTTKKVPLVVYKNGERKVIGEAVTDIDDQGHIDFTGTITDDAYKRMIQGDLKGLSLQIEKPLEPMQIKGVIPNVGRDATGDVRRSKRKQRRKDR